MPLTIIFPKQDKRFTPYYQFWVYDCNEKTYGKGRVFSFDFPVYHQNQSQSVIINKTVSNFIITDYFGIKYYD